MKSLYKISALFILLTFMSSCYEDNAYWLDENIREGGTYYPVIQNLNVAPANGDTYAAGGTAVLSLQYWSRDDVRTLDYYQTIDGVETLIESVAYQYSYDPESEAELFDYNYSIPGNASGKTIELRVEVVTVFDVIRESTTSISVE
jgi:hypothetical protein